MAEENKYNIVIEAGADFVLPWYWYDSNGNPVNLTGATIEAQLRHFAEDTNFVEFICTHNGAGGRITITLPNEITTSLAWTSGVYEVMVTPVGGLRTRLLYGDAEIHQNVTRPVDGTFLYMLGIASWKDLPVVGNTSRLYFTYDDRKIYRWNGTNYIVTSVGNGIKSIDKLSTDVLEDTYRIIFDDGTYKDYVVKNGKGIESVEKVDTDVLDDTYRITFNDGTHIDYVVTNGKGVTSVTHVDGGTYRMSFNDDTHVDFDSVPRVMGAHSSSNTYNKLDLVTASGGVYIAKKDVPASTAITNTTYWQKLMANLEMGTVTTVAYDQSASGSIGGTADAPTLNLSIPRGATGNETINDAKGLGDTDYVLSADRVRTNTDGIVIAQKLLEEGEYTLTKADLESGSWTYSKKVGNAKRIRTKSLIPVLQNTVVYFGSPTLRQVVSLYKEPISNSTNANYITGSGWVDAGDGEKYFTATADGYIGVMFESTNNITVDDYDGVVTLVTHEKAWNSGSRPIRSLWYKDAQGTGEFTSTYLSTALATYTQGIIEANLNSDDFYFVLYRKSSDADDGAYVSIDNSFTPRHMIVNFMGNCKYSIGIRKNDRSAFTRAEINAARKAFTYNRYSAPELDYEDHHGVKIAKLDSFPYQISLTYNDTSTTYGCTTFKSCTSRIYKMPKGGMQVYANASAFPFRVFFFRIQDGIFVPASDYDYSGYNFNNADELLRSSFGRYYPYEDNLYFLINSSSGVTSLDTIKIGFGTIDPELRGRLTNIIPCAYTSGVIPGSDNVTAYYPTLNYWASGAHKSDTQIHYASFIRLQDAKSVTCSAEYSMQALIYNNSHTLIGRTYTHCLVRGQVDGMNYINLEQYGKEGYAIVTIRPKTTLEIPVSGASTITHKEYGNGGIHSYEAVLDNVYVEYYNHVTVSHATGLHPTIAHNIRALRNMQFSKMFSFDYANGHTGDSRYNLLETDNGTDIVYGGASFYGNIFDNVTVKSYATALQNFNSDFYKSDWLTGTIWANYGMVCNTAVSVLHGYMWEAGAFQFYVDDAPNVCGLSVTRNWDYNSQIDLLRPGDWLIYYDEDAEGGHFVLVADIVYINGEPFCIQVIDAATPLVRYRTFFVSDPLLKFNQELINAQPISVYKAFARCTDTSRLKTLEEAYGSISTNYTVGTLMCNRGSDSVYGYSDQYCYITVNDAEMESFGVYKDDVLVDTVTLPASDSGDWVSFGDHPLKALNIISILRTNGTGYYTLIPDNKETAQESFYFAPNKNCTLEHVGNNLRVTLQDVDDIAYVIVSYVDGDNKQHRMTHLPEEFSGNVLEVPWNLDYFGETCSFIQIRVIYKTEYGTYFLRKYFGESRHYVSTYDTSATPISD